MGAQDGHGEVSVDERPNREDGTRDRVAGGGPEQRNTTTCTGPVVYSVSESRFPGPGASPVTVSYDRRNPDGQRTTCEYFVPSLVGGRPSIREGGRESVCTITRYPRPTVDGWTEDQTPKLVGK